MAGLNFEDSLAAFGHYPSHLTSPLPHSLLGVTAELWDHGIWAAAHPAAVWRWWCDFEEARPLIAASELTGFSYALADVLAQLITAKKEQQQQQQQQSSGDANDANANNAGWTTTTHHALEAVEPPFEFDVWRTARSATAGALFLGPLAHEYYHLQDALFTSLLHGAPAPAWLPVAKVAVDQTAYAATYNLVYFTVLGVSRGDDPHEVLATFRRLFWYLMKSGWRLWPIVHCITYSIIPTEHRLLWVDGIEVAWVTFLSMVASGESHVGPLQDEDQVQDQDQEDLVVAPTTDQYNAAAAVDEKHEETAMTP